MLGFNFKEIATIGMVLFAVIDIVGTIPIVVDLRQKYGHIESEKASLAAGIIMITFLFVGEELLNLIGIDVHSFAVAGSFVLFFLAIEMILGIRLYKEEEASSASIVPLAFPLSSKSLFHVFKVGAKRAISSLCSLLLINLPSNFTLLINLFISALKFS